MRATALPTGTVTFLFTDIEGSTQLLKRLRGRYGEVLVEQRRILRAVVREHGGEEVDTQGDSFLFAFPRADGGPERPSTGSVHLLPTSGQTERSCACGWASTRLSRAPRTRATTGSACTAPRGLWQPPMEARCSSRSRRRPFSRTPSSTARTSATSASIG